MVASDEIWLQLTQPFQRRCSLTTENAEWQMIDNAKLQAGHLDQVGYTCGQQSNGTS